MSTTTKPTPTAHELARQLLELPDVPVLINGWGSDEGLGPFPACEPEYCEETEWWTYVTYPYRDSKNWERKGPAIILDMWTPRDELEEAEDD